MNELINILRIGFYEGLVWFPIVLAIGILYKYLRTIDVSIDGIFVISSITFTTTFNLSGSLLVAFITTSATAMIIYSFVSILTNEFKINNILAGIIVSLILHSLSVLFIGESLPLKYESITFLNSQLVTLMMAIIVAVCTEILFRTHFGVRLKVIADNQNFNVSSNPRLSTLMIYVLSGFILSIGVIQYTSRVGLSRSGGGFEFLITALGSFLFTDRLIDIIIGIANRKKSQYSYRNFIVFSLFQSPVFKALVGSIIFQIIVLVIIYYTNNPVYWKFFFGIILLITVAKPHLMLFQKPIKMNTDHLGIILNNLSFHYDNSYEKREVFKEFNYKFEKGVNMIWGNNGVVKTSLLRLIGGKLKPNDGRIFKNGIDVTHLERHARNAFFISQVPYESISINTTVYENISAIGTKYLSIAKPEIVLKNKDLYLDLIPGVEDSFWVQKVETLSGGQAQKLNLLLCSLSEADIILADEPTSGMDETNFNLFVMFINRMQDSAKSIFIATNDERLKKLKGNHFKLSNNAIDKIL